MTKARPSEPFKYLYYNIVQEQMAEICDNMPEYAVKPLINNEEVHKAIWHTFEKYRIQSRANMASDRIDRHKIAACICGTIVELQPLVTKAKDGVSKNVNEILALYCGMGVLHCFMANDYMESTGMSEDEYGRFVSYLKDNFDVIPPQIEDNSCDTQEYAKNLVNALYWSHHECPSLKKPCFYYDIWAYATIFYHIEMYNKQKFIDVCKAYETSKTES